jgi:hypothetical protein
VGRHLVAPSTAVDLRFGAPCERSEDGLQVGELLRPGPQDQTVGAEPGGDGVGVSLGHGELALLPEIRVAERHVLDRAIDH